MNDTLHSELELSTSMVSIPHVSAGDMVFWHCDTIHAVDPVQSDSSAFYISAALLCQVNVDYLVQQRHSTT
jgi:ectoine hydroxylase-related dioxygenase (phytanoyl-CoA dioxygenase family)